MSIYRDTVDDEAHYNLWLVLRMKHGKIKFSRKSKVNDVETHFYCHSHRVAVYIEPEPWTVENGYDPKVPISCRAEKDILFINVAEAPLLTEELDNVITLIYSVCSLMQRKTP